MQIDTGKGCDFTSVIYEINQNNITPLNGARVQLNIHEHLEKNLLKIRAIMKHSAYYSSIMDDKNTKVHLIPLSYHTHSMILCATELPEQSLLYTDLEIITKTVKHILEIAHILNETRISGEINNIS